MVADYRCQLNTVGWSLCSVAIVIVGARSYCRHFLNNNFGLDDALMLSALSAGVAMTALVSAGVHHGYGLHLEDIKNARDREKALMYTYLAPSIPIVGSILGKISMVFFLVRLLGHSAKKRHLWFLYSVTGIMIGLNIFAIGVLLGGCSPMQKAWIPTTPGKCIPATPQRKSSQQSDQDWGLLDRIGYERYLTFVSEEVKTWTQGTTMRSKRHGELANAVGGS